jgi:hypothetical protein
MAKTAAVMRHPMCEVNMPSVIYSSPGSIITHDGHMRRHAWRLSAIRLVLSGLSDQRIRQT